MLKHFMVTSFLAAALMLSVGTEDAHAQTAEQEPGQEICTGPVSGSDVFSVGEIRTSILDQTQFQQLNGYEWVLMDGRPLLVRTALSPHLSSGEYGLTVPDARGRFLRMANNNACADFRGGDDEAHAQCIARHDPDGERPLGTYQTDAFRAHQHNAHLTHYGNVPRDNGPGYIGNIAPTGLDSRAPIPTTATTGNIETRPKNVAVNFYIKVCNCRTTNCK